MWVQMICSRIYSTHMSRRLAYNSYPLLKTEQRDFSTTNLEVFVRLPKKNFGGLLLWLGVALALIILATLSLYYYAHCITPC